MTSIDLSLSRLINLPIASLENVFPGSFIIFSKIIFSVLFILNSFSFLIIKSLLRSILILSKLIILLTAKEKTADRVEGLEVGADDYLSKPFEPKELILRIKNILDKTKKMFKKELLSLIILKLT